MKTVWKYQLELLANGQAENTISMPLGSAILGVHLQYGKPVLYALVDERQPHTEQRVIIFRGTGHREIPDNAIFLGTVLLHNHTLVLHFFERARA
jgi:hypothetical protein